MQKIVLDTNMFLSAFVFGGMVETIVDLIIANAFLEGSIVVVPETTVSVCRDPKDNYLLELAQEARVDYLITRDRDLLELPGSKWKNVKIIKPEEFLSILRSLNIVNK